MRRLLVVTVAFFVSVGVAASSRVPQDDKAIVHVLNRIGFGPRPGDVEKVRAIGLERYIDQQLHPERIPDAAMSARLAPLDTIGMSSREIAEKFEEPALEARREKKQAAKDPSTSLGTSDPSANQQKARAPEQQAAKRESEDRLKKWRTSVSMDRFKQLRRMYNDAGVTIYAWKALNPNMSDEEFEYVFNVAEALGCTHTTLELPTDVARLKRIGAFAEKKKIYAAYHTHLQGNMTAFDQAFAASKGNMSNVDLGHYVAGTGESPIPFLRKFHDRISSVHLKDRQTPAHGAGNLLWGTGDTPLKEILQVMKKEKYTFPASIELEYDIPQGSDAVKEVAKCLDLRGAL